MRREVPMGVAILVIAIVILLVVGVGWWYLNRPSPPLENQPTTIQPLIPGSPPGQPGQPGQPQPAQPSL